MSGQHDNELKKLRSLFTAVFSTEPGTEVLYYIMNNLCGYHGRNMIHNTQTSELLDESMEWNNARRDIWWAIRQLIPPDIVKKVEVDKYFARLHQQKKHKNVSRSPYTKKEDE